MIQETYKIILVLMTQVTTLKKKQTHVQSVLFWSPPPYLSIYLFIVSIALGLQDINVRIITKSVYSACIILLPFLRRALMPPAGAIQSYRTYTCHSCLSRAVLLCITFLKYCTLSSITSSTLSPSLRSLYTLHTSRWSDVSRVPPVSLPSGQ